MTNEKAATCPSLLLRMTNTLRRAYAYRRYLHGLVGLLTATFRCLSKHQRAAFAFSPPRYRASMTRFRGTHSGECAEPALRLHSYKSGAFCVRPVSGTFTRFPCSARTRMRVRSVPQTGSRMRHKSRRVFSFFTCLILKAQPAGVNLLHHADFASVTARLPDQSAGRPVWLCGNVISR